MMKHLRLLFTMLMLTLLGSINALADDVTVSMTSFSAISGYVDDDANISYEAAKGSAGTAPAVNNGVIRIYQNGGTFTVTANNGVKIKSVILGSAMATSVTYSVDNGTASEAQAIAENGELTVEDLNCSSILFTCMGTDKNSRLYVNNLSVTYIPSSNVATPSFNPEAGTYYGAQEVTISTTTSGATIYYTLDGNDPTTTSSVYSSPITIDETTTIKAIAVKDGLNNSEIAEARYVISELPEGWIETSLADLAEGDVFVIVGNNGSNFAMSNDNGTGTAPSAVAVTISGTILTGDVPDNIMWNVSGNADDGYTFYPAGNTEKWLYCTNTNNGVRVGTNDNKTFIIKDAYLYHSVTDRYLGVYNSSDWRCYTSIGNNINNQSFKFYKNPKPSLVVAKPTFNPAGGEFEEAQSITISCTTENAVIYYTIDGSDPDNTSTEYTGAITVSQATTIKAIAYVGTVASQVVTATYTFIDPDAPGGINNPYSVADLLDDETQTLIGSKKYIMGYIVGEFTNNDPLTSDFTGDTNIALADEFSDSPTAAASIAVQLPNKSPLREAWGNASTEGKKIGYKVLIKGDVDTYFNKDGIKGTSSIESVTIPATINDSGLASFSAAEGVALPEGVTAYIAKINGKYATLTEVENIPAETGVVLKGTAGEIALPVIGNATAVTDNELLAAVEDVEVASESVYVINGDGFYVFGGTTIPAGKAYLPKPANGAKMLQIDFGTATAIERVIGDGEASEIYNLNGIRMSGNNLPKGIYIVNGKKMVVK